MAIETYYNDQGTWRKINKFYYYDGNIASWRELADIYYNDNGTWRQVFTNLGVSLNNYTVESSRNTAGGGGAKTAFAGYTLTEDGRARETKNIGPNTDTTATTDIANDNWWTGKPQAGVGADYECRATVQGTSSGGNVLGSFNVWLDMVVDNSWSISDSCVFCEETEFRNLLIEIRDKATQTVQASANIIIRTELFGP